MKATDLQEVKRQLEQMRQKALQYTLTGYPSIDDLTGGLPKGGVTLIGGRVAMGRASLARNIATRVAARHTGNVLIFSTRSPGPEVAMRLLSIGMGMSPEKLFDGSVSREKLAVWYLDFLMSQQSNIKIIWCSNLSLKMIQEDCKKTENLNLVVVDGVETIHELTDYSVKPYEPVDKVLKTLKKVAQTENVPVIGTLRIHRSIERRKNKRPKLKDLQKVNASEDLADQIIFLYRDRYYDPFGDPEAEIIVAKNNYGNTGTVALEFDYETRRFDEIIKEII